MKIKYWGVRGSVPTPESDKLKVGGNTSCVELNINDVRIILDMGTGIRGLGKIISQEIKDGSSKEIYIMLSHTHWDHIQGFPFFSPIYDKTANITIFGPDKANRQLEAVLAGQMEYEYFPIKFSHLPAKIRFYELSEGYHSLIDGIQITAKRHIHPGVAFGYRIQSGEKSIVYSTDTEHYQSILDKRVIELSEDTDLLIHDAQYTDDEIGFRLGWGHSTWMQAIQVAKESKAKKLALFHVDPDRNDEECLDIEKKAQIVFNKTNLAIEGQEINI